MKVGTIIENAARNGCIFFIFVDIYFYKTFFYYGKQED